MIFDPALGRAMDLGHLMVTLTFTPTLSFHAAKGLLYVVFRVYDVIKGK